MKVLHSKASVRAALLLVICPALMAAGCATSGASAESTAPVPPDPIAKMLSEKLGDPEKREGLLDFYVDRKAGKIWLELPAPRGETGEAMDDGMPESKNDEADVANEGIVGEFLYVEGLLTGLGSNPVGLDRGQLGETRLVVFRRLGNRLLVEQPNLGFRALSDDPRERRATRQSFADSVLWAGTIEERSPDGRSLVDFTSFLIRDAHGVSAQLKQTGQGNYRLDSDRSAVDFSACLAFPDNLEFEALLTYAADEPGGLVSRTAPIGGAFGLVQHHSLIRLPDDGYTPRLHDPRAGSFAIGFQDYAAALDESIQKRWIVRHRLSKDGPDSELVYHVDPGVPEPVRGALVDGASWWADAFETAGLPGVYRVEILPDDAHPLDVRYNVIQWVHRSTRGWSYGGGVVDPRTGEMIKGHVSLGSLRVRQDRLIFEGLLGTDKTGSGDADDPVELALARIRQLSAHEVGHTLGFAHNFAASTYGRASVMDYPAPMIRVAADGALDVSEAYAVGVGEWDRHAARYAYSEFADADAEAAGLEAIVRDGIANGLAFISDADARPPGAAQPVGSLWDNGEDAAEELANELEVRRIALAGFGEGNVPEGTPLALLEEVLAPVYFHHRYQLEAATKMVGGLDYGYPVRGDGQGGVEPLAAADQRRALNVVLSALAPEALDLPDEVLALLAPRPFGYRPNRELFDHRTAPAFDSLGAAATAAGIVTDGLLQQERAARLVDQHRRDDGLPGFTEVLEKLVAMTFGDPEAETARRREIRREVQAVVVDRLITLGLNDTAAASVRARAEGALRTLADDLSGPSVEPPEMALAARIQRYLDRSAAAEIASIAPPEIPPGSPIGEQPALGGAAFRDDCSMGTGAFLPGGGRR